MQPSKTITDFGMVETAETVAIIVTSDRPLTYTASRQENPQGVSFRFAATRLEGLDAVYYPPANPVIRSIRSTQAKDGGEARVFLEYVFDAPYEVIQDDTGLKIVFSKPLAAAAAGKKPVGSAAKHLPAESAQAVPPAAVLREIRIETHSEGVEIRVIADRTLKTAKVFTLEIPARIVFDLVGLQSTFQGEQRVPVGSEWVSQVRHLGYPDKVRLVADTDGRYLKSYSMEPTADGLHIAIGARKP